MGYADSKYYAGLVETPKVVFKHKPGPLSDTLQAGACVFPPFQKSLDHMVKIDQSQPSTHFSLYALTHVAFLQFLPTGQYGLIVIRSAPSTFPQRTGHLLGAISGSP